MTSCDRYVWICYSFPPYGGKGLVVNEKGPPSFTILHPSSLWEASLSWRSYEWSENKTENTKIRQHINSSKVYWLQVLVLRCIASKHCPKHNSILWCCTCSLLKTNLSLIVLMIGLAQSVLITRRLLLHKGNLKVTIRGCCRTVQPRGHSQSFAWVSWPTACPGA